MIQPLNEPIFEVNQDSAWYAQIKKRETELDELFIALHSEFGFQKGFSFYTSEHFGLKEDSQVFDTYRDQLLKNPNKDGVYIFKKRSASYPLIKALIEKVEDADPFKPHDVFGRNNMLASQWINDRWFFSIKNKNLVTDSEEVTPIDYKDYLVLIMENL